MTGLHPHTEIPTAPRSRPIDPRGIVRIGVAGPVGSGKTATLLALCRKLYPLLDLAVVTNDIYTEEDARILRSHAALPDDRIIGVATGACPHSAIREDPSLNLAAIDTLAARHPRLELILIESGAITSRPPSAPNSSTASSTSSMSPAATRSRAKAGPAPPAPTSSSSTKDLAPYVGASLDVMERAARAARGDRPILVTNMNDPADQAAVAAWVTAQVAALRQ
ncbi:GTP-binding protein [Tepidiforma flava]|uniref:GTP-binding protein n=1 Tax=Tepidiforma flava TaxID=3004094 RepID=UPI0027E3FD34|nr:GTP-binding protein [Tepidiforma flava]